MKNTEKMFFLIIFLIPYGLVVFGEFSPKTNNILDLLGGIVLASYLLRNKMLALGLLGIVILLVKTYLTFWF